MYHCYPDYPVPGEKAVHVGWDSLWAGGEEFISRRWGSQVYQEQRETDSSRQLFLTLGSPCLQPQEPGGWGRGERESRSGSTRRSGTCWPVLSGTAWMQSYKLLTRDTSLPGPREQWMSGQLSFLRSTWTRRRQLTGAQWFRLVPWPDLDRFWGKKVPTEGTFFWLELQQKQKWFWNTNYLLMTIGGVQDDQFNLNSTKKHIFQNLIWKNLNKNRLNFLLHPSFYRTPN